MFRAVAYAVMTFAFALTFSSALTFTRTAFSSSFAEAQPLLRFKASSPSGFGLDSLGDLLRHENVFLRERLAALAFVDLACLRIENLVVPAPLSTTA